MAANDLGQISTALLDALREAQALAHAGEYGAPLRKVLDACRQLVARADAAFESYPGISEDARSLTLHMAEQLAVLEALVEP
jgi:hypothetical protein